MVYFLGQVEGGSTDVKGVPKGHAPAMGFEHSVDVHESSVLDHRADVTLIVSPQEQGVIWSSWDNAR